MNRIFPVLFQEEGTEHIKTHVSGMEDESNSRTVNEASQQ